jgi:hypothetical protein
MLERRDIEVAEQNRALRFLHMHVRAVAHLVEETELVLEFRVEFRIRKVAAGGHVEIVQGERIFQVCLFSERHAHVAAIDLAAESPRARRLERKARKDRDPVITLLPVHRDMLVAEAPEALHRKGVVGTFRFLQAQHIRPCGLDVFGHEVDAKSDGIDVPGGDFDLHAGLLAARAGVVMVCAGGGYAIHSRERRAPR